MSKTIQDYFDNAQLSQASYAMLVNDMTNSQIKKALETEQGESTYSDTQASQFAQKYSIVHSQQNTTSGFSATVFKDTAGGYTFAIRGTEPSDFGPDVLSADFGDIGGDGIALKQAVDLFNYYQLLTTATNSQAMQLEFYEDVSEPPANNVPFQKNINAKIDSMGREIITTTYSYLKVVDTLTGLGKIPSTAEINVAGHSLGGHLALILARLDPAHINQVYTYNAPGFNTFISSNDTDWFFNTVNQLQQQEQGLSSVSVGGFPNEKIHNLIIPKDVISDIGHIPNGQIEQFGEAQNPASAHSVTGMVDSLAIYNLLRNLSPDLNFEQITPLLQLGANQPEADLEGILNAVGDLFLSSSVPKAETGNRETYYKRLQAIAIEIYIDTDTLTPILNPQYQNLHLVDVNSLVDSAKDDTADGFAYRYALKNLNPFGIRGNSNLYSQHNQNGELNSENFSDQYLQDKSEFLSIKNEAYSKDYRGVTDVAKDEIRFQDLNTNITIELNGGILGVAKRITFGSNNDEISGELDGDRNDDHLYGGGGFDIIHGNKGNDYIEGNSGDDILYGDEGSDTLIGGTGGDNLHGNASGDHADILDGGQGHDIYHIETGDGDTIIRDSDLQGQIEYDGKTLGSNNIKAVVDGSNSYQDDDKNKYTFTTNNLIITLENGQRIVIENYTEADQGKLGLSFGGADTVAPPPITSTTIVGDYEWKDFDLDTAGIQPHLDGLGNEIQDFDKPQDMRDSLNGSGGFDTISSGAENDSVHARGGNDLIFGGQGIDMLYGEAGDDHIRGDEGSDILYGGAGEDILHADGIQNLTVALNAENNRNSRGSLLSGGGDDKLWFFLKTLLQLSNKLNYTQENNRDTAHNLISIN